MGIGDLSPLDFMHRAIALAQQAETEGEVPVGAVIVKDGRIIGEGYNRTIQDHDPSAHAEIIALRSAGEWLGNYRLVGCDIYVTLEPCPMCASALVHARVNSLTYGASDPRTGAAGSVFNLVQSSQLNHRLRVLEPLLTEPCAQLLQAFFKARRSQVNRA